MRVITLHHNDELVLYKVVGDELSIRDYQQKNQANHKNHSDWSAFYAQLCPIHAKGTIPYRWDQGYDIANLLRVTIKGLNEGNAVEPLTLSADATADSLVTSSKQTSADAAIGYDMTNLLCVTAQTNNNKGNVGALSSADITADSSVTGSKHTSAAAANNAASLQLLLIVDDAQSQMCDGAQSQEGKAIMIKQQLGIPKDAMLMDWIGENMPLTMLCLRETEQEWELIIPHALVKSQSLLLHEKVVEQYRPKHGITYLFRDTINKKECQWVRYEEGETLKQEVRVPEWINVAVRAINDDCKIKEQKTDYMKLDF